MNHNVLNDKKVCQQLGGEKAAVRGQGECLNILVEKYDKAAEEVM